MQMLIDLDCACWDMLWMWTHRSCRGDCQWFPPIYTGPGWNYSQHAESTYRTREEASRHEDTPKLKEHLETQPQSNPTSQLNIPAISDTANGPVREVLVEPWLLEPAYQLCKLSNCWPWNLLLHSAKLQPLHDPNLHLIHRLHFAYIPGGQVLPGRMGWGRWVEAWVWCWQHI